MKFLKLSLLCRTPPPPVGWRNSVRNMLYLNITSGEPMETTLRKVGGSVMLIVPPALLDMLQLRPGAKICIVVHKGRLVVEPRPRPRYTLNELLAQCNRKGRRTKQEQEWLGNKPAGRELI